MKNIFGSYLKRITFALPITENSSLKTENKKKG